jgi:hypothetical protein
MILVLQKNGSVALEEPADFRRFHCEIDPAFKDLQAARKAFAGIGEIESEETAWVDQDALFALGEASQGAPWRAQAQAMVAAAAKYGWVRDRAPAIKSHIVWRR